MRISFLNCKDLTRKNCNGTYGFALGLRPFADIVILAEVRKLECMADLLEKTKYTLIADTTRDACLDSSDRKGLALIAKFNFPVEVISKRRKHILFKASGLRVLATHLPNLPKEYGDPEPRKKHVSSLLKLIQEYSPHLVLGDLNDGPNGLHWLKPYRNCWIEIQGEPEISTHAQGGMLDHCYISNELKIPPAKVRCFYSDRPLDDQPPDHSTIFVEVQVLSE